MAKNKTIKFKILIIMYFKFKQMSLYPIHNHETAVI